MSDYGYGSPDDAAMYRYLGGVPELFVETILSEQLGMGGSMQDAPVQLSTANLQGFTGFKIIDLKWISNISRRTAGHFSLMVPRTERDYNEPST